MGRGAGKLVLTAGALNQAKFALGGLTVNERQMAKNLGLSRGLIVAKATMMGLSSQLGWQRAHDLVYDACRVVNERGASLTGALLEFPEIQATIERLTGPANYLGQAGQMDRVLGTPRRAVVAKLAFRRRSARKRRP